MPGSNVIARVPIPDVEKRADDWDKICLGQARVENEADFIRTNKRKDKVRLSGIAYDPADVSERNPGSPCTARRLDILGCG